MVSVPGNQPEGDSFRTLTDLNEASNYDILILKALWVPLIVGHYSNECGTLWVTTSVGQFYWDFSWSLGKAF